MQSWRKLLLFVSICILGALLGTSLIAGLLALKGGDLLTLQTRFMENPTLENRNLMRAIQILSHLSMFMLPACFYAWRFHRPAWQESLGMKRVKNGYIFMASLLLILAVLPLAQFSYWVNQLIPFSDAIMKQEKTIEETLKGLLIMESPVELLYMLLMAAVIPAIGEEMVFRGVFQQELQKSMKSGHLAVWITAALFSLIHFQFLGFLPRLILGAALGYVFLWSGNLWASIIAHFLINGIQVVLYYFYGDSMDLFADKSSEGAPWLQGIVGFVLCFGVYMLVKRILKTQIPPQPDTDVAMPRLNPETKTKQENEE